MRERILPAKVQHHDGLGFGVLFIVGKAGLDEQLFADKPGRCMAALADDARGAETGDRRGNGRGITIDRDFNKLLSAIHLGGEVRGRAGADVALHTVHVGVRRDLVGCVFRMHDVAGLAAELWRVHIGGTAITGHGNDQQIHDGGHQHDVKAVAKDAVVEIYFGELCRNQPGLLERSATDKHAHRNQQQSGYEHGREQQEKDDP